MKKLQETVKMGKQVEKWKGTEGRMAASDRRSLSPAQSRYEAFIGNASARFQTKIRWW
jgi:hypothetical protein